MNYKELAKNIISFYQIHFKKESNLNPCVRDYGFSVNCRCEYKCDKCWELFYSHLDSEEKKLT